MRFLFVVSLFAVIFQCSKADFLDDYFNDKTFGINPGPCRERSFEDCKIEDLVSEDLPPSLGGATFCLINELPFIGDAICATLAEWLQSADLIEIWDLQCSNLGVGDMTITKNGWSTGNVGPLVTSLSNFIDIPQVTQRCTGMTRLEEVRLEYDTGFFGLVVTITLTLESAFTTQNEGDGLDVSFELLLTTNEPNGFVDNLPNGVDIVEDSCDLDLDLGLEINTDVDGGDFEKLEVGGFNIAFLAGDQLTNLIIDIVLFLFEASVCSVIEQGGTLDSGQPGVLLEALNFINTEYDELIVPTVTNVPFDDNDFITNPAKYVDPSVAVEAVANTIDFSTDPFIEFLSVTLNQFLGEISDSGILGINEAIELLTEPAGYFELTGDDLDLSIELPLLVSNVTVSFEKFAVEGLNNIDTFAILENGFGTASTPLKRTLNHSLTISDISLVVSLGLLFERGEWVTASSCGSQSAGFNPSCTSDTEEFSFDFSLAVTGVSFDASTLVALDLDQLLDVRIGSIIDLDTADLSSSLFNALQCAAPAIYAFNFTDLSVSVANIGAASVDNFSGPGLTAFINGVTDLVTTLINPVFAKDLPFILQGPGREAINDILKTDVGDITAETSICPEYVPTTSPDPYLRFDEFPLSAVFAPINDVLGDFSSGVDLNDFVDVILNYYSDNSDSFPLEESTTTPGDWVIKKPEYDPMYELPSFNLSGDAYIRVENLEIRNLNSFYYLNVDSNGPYGVNVDVGIGTNSDPLTILIDFEVNVDELDTEERLTLEFILEELEVGVDITEMLVNADTFNALEVRQLLHLPCLVAIFDGITAPKNLRRLTVGSLDFNVINRVEGNDSDLQRAIDILEAEFAGLPSNQSKFRLNSGLELIWDSLWDTVEATDYSATADTCSAIDSTAQDIISILIGFGLPNATTLVNTCLGPIEPLQDATTLEQERLGVTDFGDLGASYIDFTDSFIFEFVESSLDLSPSGDGDAGLIDRILVSLANSTGNPISDVLILEEDDETVSLLLQLNEVNPLFEVLGLDPLVLSTDDGYLAEISTLKVKGINKFLNELQLFQIVSTFTTRHSIGFTEANPLAVEIDFLFQANATFNGDPPSDPLVEDGLSLELNLSGVAFDLQLVTAVNTDILGALSLGHFINVNPDQSFFISENALDCFFTTFFDGGIHISDFQISVDEVDGPVLNSTLNPPNQILSRGVQEIANEIIVILSLFYLEAIPNICQNCLRVLANEQLEALFESATEEDGRCPDDPVITNLPGNSAVLNFAESAAIASLQSFLDDFLFDNDYNLLNQLVGAITDTTLFTDQLSTGFIDLFYNGVNYGAVSVGLRNTILKDWDTFTNAEFLRPVFPSDEGRRMLDFELASGDEPFVTRIQFDITGRESGSPDPEEGAKFESIINVTGKELFVGFDSDYVVNEVQTEFRFTNISLGIDLLLKLNITKMLDLRWNSITTLEEIPCLFVPVKQFGVVDFYFTIDDIDFGFSCAGQCDSPLIQQSLVGGAYESDESQEIADFFNFILAFAVEYVSGSPLQDLVDAQIATADETCADIIAGITGIFDGNPDTVDVFPFLGKAFLGFVLIGGSGLAFLLPLHKKRKKKVLQEFSKKNMVFTVEQEAELLNDEMKSIYHHDATPWAAKILLPVACLANIGALIVASLYSGALNIVIKFIVLGMETTTVTLVPFTVISTVNDIWASGAWPLALLIGVGSIMWPMVKNAMLFVIFFCPTTILDARTRYMLLELFDIFGKWSFLDVFVVVLTLAALKTYVVASTQTNLQFLDESFLITDVSVTPERGIVLLCIICCTSLIVNHTMAYYHQKAQHMNRRKYDKIAGNPNQRPKPATAKKSLSQHKFGSRVVSRKAIYHLKIFNAVTWLTMIVGCFVPLITFELNGLVGLLLETFDQSYATRTYTIYNLGTVITEAPSENVGDDFVNYFFQFLYYLVCFICPIIQGMALHVLLHAKFSLDNLKAFLTITMIISFWSVLECVLVALVFTTIEIGQVSEFIVDFITNDRCSDIKALLQVFVSEQDGSCLDVVGYMNGSSIILFLGVFGQLFVLLAATVLANSIMEDRYYHAYVKSGLRPRDGKPKPPTKIRRWILNLLTIKRLGRKSGRTRNTAIQTVDPTNMSPIQSPATSLTFSDSGVGAPSRTGSTNPMFPGPQANNLFKPIPAARNPNPRDSDVFARMDAHNRNNSPEDDSDDSDIEV